MQYNKEEDIIRMYLRGRLVNMYVPSEAIDNYDPHKVSVPPQSKLKLDWVYGYRGRDCRNNLHLLPTGEVVYFVASVVVLYNTEEHCQRHYLAHTDDVKWSVNKMITNITIIKTMIFTLIISYFLHTFCLLHVSILFTYLIINI
jgi:hypothetical protein